MLLLAAAAAPVLAAAPAVQEAQALLTQGDYNGALQRLDSYLASSPQDAEARFSRGLALVKLNRTDEAIKAFSELTRDYPQLPEPYNNLAVLYAQKGDYEKARDALEAALATHPAYATAHENLGDIYSALAGAAYNRALQLDQSNQAVRYKLSLINQLGNGPGGYVAAGPAAKPAPAAAASAPAPAAPPPAPPVAAAAPAPLAAPVAAASADQQPAIDTVNAWAKAWADKDVDGYLSYYAADFEPESGDTHAQWEAQRRERLAKPSHITVRLSGTHVTRVDAHTLQVDFVQEYVSDTVKDKARKSVQLSDSSGSWKIVRESIR